MVKCAFSFKYPVSYWQIYSLIKICFYLLRMKCDLDMFSCDSLKCTSPQISHRLCPICPWARWACRPVSGCHLGETSCPSKLGRCDSWCRTPSACCPELSGTPINTRKTKSSKRSSRSWDPQPVRPSGKTDVIKSWHVFLCLTHQNMWGTAELLIINHTNLISCFKPTHGTWLHFKNRNCLRDCGTTEGANQTECSESPTNALI